MNASTTAGDVHSGEEKRVLNAVAWPTKHVGVRFEVREIRTFVSYGALENVAPGGKFVEFRIAFTLR